MAEEDLVLNIPIRYIFPSESPMETLGRQAAEGATFGSPGSRRGGAANPEEASLRLQQSAFDRQMANYSLGGALNEEGAGTRSRAFIWSRILAGTTPNFAQNYQQAQWETGHARAQEAWEDRNEARYSRSEDAAAFSSFRQGQRDTVRGYKRQFQDWNRQQAVEDRNELRYTRNKDAADFQKFRNDEREAEEENAPPSGVQFGPGGGMYADYNKGMAAEQASNGSWSRRNLPTVRKFMGIGDKGGGMSTFYRRFLITEAIRSVGQIAQIASEEAAGIANTGGDPLGMANFGVSNARSMADAVPFIGQIGFAGANALTGAGTAVARARLAQMGVALGDQRLGISGERFGIGQSASVASTPRGMQRDQASIEADLQTSIRAARDRETKESVLNTQQADQARADISSRIHASGFLAGVLDDFGFTNAAYSSLDGITQKGRTLAARHRAGDEANANIIAKQREQDLQTDQNLSATRGLSEGSLMLSQAFSAIRPQGQGFFDPRVRAQQQIQQLGFADAQANNQQDLTYSETSAKSGRGVADALLPGMQAERQARAQNVIIQSREIQAQADREISTMKIGLSENAGLLRASLGRDPSAGIDARYDADISRSRQLPGDMQGAAQVNARSQRDLSRSELVDRQTALGGSLGLQESVSGLQAQAFGPGADSKRRQAELLSISGSAELSAQSILKNRDLGTDSQRLSFADSARRTGVNQLEGYAANYLSGFRSVEKSQGNIAAGNQDSSSPSAVLHSIDDQIRGLKSNVGNGDITGAKGSLGGDSVPNLLLRLIQVVEQGAFTATN